MVDIKSVFNKYDHLPYKDKLHFIVRIKTVPWDVILNNIPSGHTLVDVGCGHGLFINLLSAGNVGFERYIGVDKDPHKINVARQIENEYISFYNCDLFDLEESPDVYSFFDVLYLIPYDVQERIIKYIFNKLPRNGYLVIKEVNTKPAWKFTLNQLQETLSVKLLNITYGEHFYFRSEQEFINLLEGVGFSVKRVYIDKGYLHPHILYICRK